MNELVKFENYLRAHGQKMTRPREVILEAFLKTEGHLSIDDILREAKKIDAGIGQATVFRTIRLIADAGLAREALQEDGARTFEHLADHPHHDHLLCVGCGKVIEFLSPVIEREQQKIFVQYGFAPRGHMMELLGLCPECQAKERGEH
ncbi:Ferric uptake regulator, Fur family [uncultured spirochete]|uniref:Ferric uptake regulation protein n=1 Tax=uncultured spirochete TaxID=156406 RepID=A0A3P3XQL4_9SPIR|nr:Ferric uptake regulator, Fur family [uncultured spirochete]